MNNKNTKPKETFYFDNSKSIYLADSLDLILERNINTPCSSNDTNKKLFVYEQIISNKAKILCKAEISGKENAKYYSGGIRLIQKDDKKNIIDYGSGNILICGSSGSGKSTLAFQIAEACTTEYNEGIAIYYSLEVEPIQVKISMCNKGNGENKVKLLECAMGEEDSDSSESLKELIEKVLKGKEETIQSQILMPSLSPCSLSSNEEEHNNLFIRRFQEIEKMLRAVKKYNCNTGKPKIKLIVIDSLNAFSNRPLSHEEIIRLFDLFKQYETIGVFIIGDNLNEGTIDVDEINNAKFLADTVINLRQGIKNDYTYSYIEISKSRYIQQVVGQQPYKIIQQANNDKNVLKKK